MNIISFTRRAWGRILTILYHHQYKHIHKTSVVYYSAHIYNPDNLYMAENTNIDGGAIIMNSRAKLIVKKNTGAAVGLLVVTGNHLSVVGMNFSQVTNDVKDKLDKEGRMDQDVIIDEDVWIGARVTLFSGSHVGRGAEIGGGSVVRGIIPPYSIVIGNPAKVVGFRFRPEDIIEHEKVLYPEEERLPLDLLEKNYNKYFLKRIKEIKEFTRI